MSSLASTPPPRIGWVISGDKTVASSRLQGQYIHEYLVDRGLDSEIACTRFNEIHPSYSLGYLRLGKRLLKRNYDIVFFERPNWMMYKLSEILRAHGTQTVAIRCDPLPGPYDAHFDLTIVPSEALARKLGLVSYRVIDDMIEVPEPVYKRSYAKTGERLKVVWVGHGSYGDFIRDFSSQLNQNKLLRGRIELVTISKGDWATHQWALDSVFSQICVCDLAIIPMPEGERFNAKSTNRLTMFMALGMPAVVSPIAPYLTVGREQVTCLFADTVNAFGEAIARLESQTLRESLGRTARTYARLHYCRDAIGKRWLEAIEELVIRRKVSSGSFKTRLLGRLMLWC